MTLTDEQKLAVTTRGGTLLVSAAAGSGKTRVLVHRLLDRVLDPDDPQNVDDFLLITFTRAAAAEMRGRVQAELFERLQNEPHNAHLRRQTVRVYGAQISTLDAYCQKLTRQYAALCGVHPDTRVLVGAERDTLHARILDDVLEQLYANESPDSPFFKLAETLATARGDAALAAQILSLYETARSHPDPLGWLQSQVNAFSMPEDADVSETRWGALILPYVRGQLTYHLDALRDALALSETEDKLYKAYSTALSEDIAAGECLLTALDESWDNAAALLACMPRARLGVYRGADKQTAEAIKSARKSWQNTCEHLGNFLEGSSALLREEITAVRPVLDGLLLAVCAFDEALNTEKRRLKALDYMDYEHLANSLLGARELAAEEARRFTEIFVDEYQDISPLQESIIQALSQDGRNLFLVGDVRQSIYRFRLADPTCFLRKYRSYPDALTVPDGCSDPRRILLTRNFRSAPEILQAVNHVFSRIMSRDAGELPYTSAEYVNPGLNPEAHAQSPAVELMVTVSPRASAGEESAETGSREAAAIASRIRELLNCGFPVSDGCGGSRPCRASDMAVLLRSPRPRVSVYQSALEAAGVPLTIRDSGGEDFFTSPEIHAAIALLQLIDNPLQDVPLLTALRCPAYRLDADELAALRSDCPDGSFTQAFLNAAEHEQPVCARLYADLQILRDLSPVLPADQVLELLYERSELLVHCGRERGGKQKQERLRQLQVIAQDSLTVTGFLEALERMRESGAGPDSESRLSKPDAVQLLSVHQSKGLEYPIVVFADLSKQFSRQDEQQFLLTHPVHGLGPRLQSWETYTRTDTLAHRALSLTLRQENLAEEMRILYVAMTRAREKLILSCAPPSAPELAPPPNAVPPALVQRANSMASWLFACADTENWGINVLDGNAVLAALTAEASEPPALVDTSVSADPELLNALSWVYPHAEAVELPSKMTVTGLKGRFLDAEAHENTEPAAPPVKKPTVGLSAAERGSAQHLAMQHLNFTVCTNMPGIQSELDRLTAKRLLTPEQREAVDAAAILRLLQGEWGKRMLCAEGLRREFKFSLLWGIEDLTGQPAGGEKTLFQGVIDCFWETPHGFVLLDFKTDALRPGGEAQRALTYKLQLDLYARALTRIFQKPVAEKAVYFFSTGTAVTM